MNIKIQETGKIETLSIRSNDIEWTQDLIGNAGALNDGQFVWSEDDNAYLAAQDTFDWWAKYIESAQRTEQDASELADNLGISLEQVIERISEYQTEDYEQHRRQAIHAMHELMKEHA